MNPQQLLDALEALAKSVDTLNATMNKPPPNPPGGGSGGGTVGKLTGAYKAFSNAGQSISAARTGNVTGAINSLMGAGQAAEGAAAAAGGIAAASVAVVGAFVGVGYAMWEFKKALDASTAATIQQYREWSKVSGSMAAVMAQRDVREMLREREKGERLAGVAGAVTNAEQFRADAGKEFDIAWEEFKGGFLVAFNAFMGAVEGTLSDIAITLKQYFGGYETQSITESLGGSLENAAKKSEQKYADHKRDKPIVGGRPNRDF